jgi:hypothetical protein
LLDSAPPADTDVSIGPAVDTNTAIAVTEYSSLSQAPPVDTEPSVTIAKDTGIALTPSMDADPASAIAEDTSIVLTPPVDTDPTDTRALYAGTTISIVTMNGWISIIAGDVLRTMSLRGRQKQGATYPTPGTSRSEDTKDIPAGFALRRQFSSGTCPYHSNQPPPSLLG